MKKNGTANLAHILVKTKSKFPLKEVKGDV